MVVLVSVFVWFFCLFLWVFLAAEGEEESVSSG